LLRYDDLERLRESFLPRRLDKSTNVDTLTDVDMRSRAILKLLRRTKELTLEFCDRCARVCAAACRADAIRARALLSRAGVRL
jgi:hypothetical protein